MFPQLLYRFADILDDLDLEDFAENVIESNPLEKSIVGLKAFSQRDSSEIEPFIDSVPFFPNPQGSGGLVESRSPKEGAVDVKGNHRDGRANRPPSRGNGFEEHKVLSGAGRRGERDRAVRFKLTSPDFRGKALNHEV